MGVNSAISFTYLKMSYCSGIREEFLIYRKKESLDPIHKFRFFFLLIFKS